MTIDELMRVRLDQNNNVLKNKIVYAEKSI